MVLQALPEEGGRRGAERQPHHAAARRRRRRHGRGAHRVPGGPQLALRHGARGRRPSTWPTPTRVVRFPYHAGRDADHRRAGARSPTCPPARINHHWTKNVIANADGSKLYVAVGSNSNVAEHGMAEEEGARRHLGDRPRRPARTACSPPACATPSAWPGSRDSGALWTAVNERDELGSDLVPDYMTSVKDGAFYGWPYSYYGQNVDARAEAARGPTWSPRRDPARLRARPAHGVARPRLRERHALPRAFAHGHVRGPARLVEPQAAQRLQGDLRARSTAARPAGDPVDVLTGFVDERRQRDGPAGGRRHRQARRAAAWPTTSATRSGG